MNKTAKQSPIYATLEMLRTSKNTKLTSEKVGQHHEMTTLLGAKLKNRKYTKYRKYKSTPRPTGVPLEAPPTSYHP